MFVKGQHGALQIAGTRCMCPFFVSGREKTEVHTDGQDSARLLSRSQGEKVLSFMQLIMSFFWEADQSLLVIVIMVRRRLIASVGFTSYSPSAV